MENSGGLCKKIDSGELQMEHYSIRQETENNSAWLQMENVSGERFAAGE